MSENRVQEVVRVVRPEEGTLIAWFGSLLNVKASSGSTGGSYSLVEIVEPNGAASPVHVHHGEVETVYVLEGEYRVRCGEQEAVAPAGTLAVLPRGVPHSIQVISQGGARALMLFTPGGFERFFQEAGQPTDKRELPPPSAPNPAELAAIGSRYELEIVGPPPGH